MSAIRALAVVAFLGWLTAGLTASAANSADCGATKLRLLVDYDDTTKETNVLSVVNEVDNTAFSSQFFPGIPELYRGYAADNCAPIDFVSGGYARLTWLTESDLRDNQVPFEFVHERPNLEISIHDFKTDEFDAAHAHLPGRVMAMGDDTQTDPEVLTERMAAHPAWIVAGYIHVVTGRALPVGAIPYYSTFEVAFMEHSAGRASLKTVEYVAEAIINISNPTSLFPKYLKCPESTAAFSAAYRDAIRRASPELAQLANQINSFMTNLCVERNSQTGLLALAPE